jgi:hypothetical protein
VKFIDLSRDMGGTDVGFDMVRPLEGGQQQGFSKKEWV